MKKTQNDSSNWDKIFPELDIYEIQSNNLAEFGDQTIQSVASEDFFTMSNTALTDDWQKWDSWSNLTASGLPSLTASDVYSIDFANIGNITTINLSALNTTASSAIWAGSAYTNTSLHTVKINNQGTIEIPEGGDLKIGNVSLTDRLDRIESRLAILYPNPELEKEFSELKALGEQYRNLEQEIKERIKTFETLKRE